MTPEEEIQAHFEAQLRRDFDAIFEPQPTAQLHKTQEGRIIRVVADETITSRDSIG
jgi:hypothetical protein